MKLTFNNDESIKTIVHRIVKSRDLSITGMCEQYSKKYHNDKVYLSNFSNKLYHGTLTLAEFLQVLETLNLKMVVTDEPVTDSESVKSPEELDKMDVIISLLRDIKGRL